MVIPNRMPRKRVTIMRVSIQPIVVMAVFPNQSAVPRKPQSADARAKRVNDTADAIRLQGKTGCVKTPNRESGDKPESKPHGQPGGEPPLTRVATAPCSMISWKATTMTKAMRKR